MADNLIEVDTFPRMASLMSKCQSAMPVMAFFYFAAAFPSVAWAYWWMCMRYSGLPARFIGAFKKLYFRNVHFLRFMGAVFQAYVNESGAKTGGPASGSIFVLCPDPFLQLLRSHCGPRDIGRAFADDIGYAIMDIRIRAPGFAKCFDQFGEVSNIKLKIKKQS